MEEGEGGMWNQYTFKAQLHTAKKIILNKFILLCVIVQLYVHVVLRVRISIAYWITLYVLGNRGTCS